jgi:hypothetical protein
MHASGAGHLRERSEALGALVTYVHTWTPYAQLHPGVDFLLTTFESWRRAVGHFPERKFDLVAVAAASTADRLMAHRTVGRLCTHLEMPRHAWKRGMSLSTALLGTSDLQRLAKNTSQCWIFTSLDDISVWAGHVLVRDLLHFVNPAFEHFVEHMGYNMLLKVRCKAMPPIPASQKSSAVRHSCTPADQRLHLTWHAFVSVSVCWLSAASVLVVQSSSCPRP